MEESLSQLEREPKQILPGDFIPGDLILFEIDSNAGDVTKMIWGIVLVGRKSGRGIRVVVDQLFIMNGTAHITPNDVLQIEPSKVLAVIKHEDEGSPVVHVSVQSGVVTDVRRVDGRTEPVVILLDDDDNGEVFTVDHTGRKNH